MQLFQGEVMNGLDEEAGDPGEEAEVIDETKTRDRDKEVIAAAMSDDYANMPYPIIIDTGATASVLPTPGSNWVVQRKMAQRTPQSYKQRCGRKW